MRIRSGVSAGRDRENTEHLTELELETENPACPRLRFEKILRGVDDSSSALKTVDR